MRKIVEVKLVEDYRLGLVFDDGTQGIADLSDLVGRGVFLAWNEKNAFASVCIGPSGELVWGDQIDLCPDSLYLRVTGKKPEDLFPNLKTEPANA